MEMMIYAILSVSGEPIKLKSLLADLKGIDEEDLYIVSYEDICAVVSNVKRANLITDKKNAIEYAEVIEKLAQHFTLLPVRFGSILESGNTLIKMLERNYIGMEKNLEFVKNKLEFGLKIFCDSEKLISELRAKSETGISASGNKTTVTNSVYRQWVNRKLEEHRIEESLLSYIDAVIATLTEQLIELKAVHKFKKMTSSTIIIDGVFLLKKVKKSDLIKVIADLQNLHPRLNFVLTGPWAPYNFVDVSIN
jgi:hypothetical protein